MSLGGEEYLHKLRHKEGNPMVSVALFPLKQDDTILVDTHVPRDGIYWIDSYGLYKKIWQQGWFYIPIGIGRRHIEIRATKIKGQIVGCCGY